MREPTTPPATQPLAQGKSSLSKKDEAVQGLLEACKSHFPEPDYEVECDARHTVWVKRLATRRSIGLPPWLLRDHTLTEVLERADTKLVVH